MYECCDCFACYLYYEKCVHFMDYFENNKDENCVSKVFVSVV